MNTHITVIKKQKSIEVIYSINVKILFFKIHALYLK